MQQYYVINSSVSQIFQQKALLLDTVGQLYFSWNLQLLKVVFLKKSEGKS